MDPRSKAVKQELIAKLYAACPVGGCRRGVNGIKKPWCEFCRAAVTIAKQMDSLAKARHSLKALHKRCQMVEAAAGAKAFSEDGRRVSKYLHDQIRMLRAEVLTFRRQQWEQENANHREIKRIIQLGEQQIKSGVGGVYFIESGGLVKIGISRDVRHRLRTLNHAQHQEVRPLAFIREHDLQRQRALESELHQRFAAHRHRGEWFKPSDEIRAFIATEAGPWPA